MLNKIEENGKNVKKRENMLEFVGKIEEIKETISITHYPQGVVHLIHSFKLMRSLSTMKDNSNKKIFVVYEQNKMRTWYLNVINRWGVQTFYHFKSVRM